MQLAIQSITPGDGGTLNVAIVDNSTGNSGMAILRQEVFGTFLQQPNLVQELINDVLNLANNLSPGGGTVQQDPTS